MNIADYESLVKIERSLKMNECRKTEVFRKMEIESTYVNNWQLHNSKNERNVTITLMAIGISYMALTLPYQLHWFYNMIRELTASGSDDLGDKCRMRQLQINLHDITFTCRNLNYVFN